MTPIGERLTAFDLGEEESLADKFANHRQPLWQEANGMYNWVEIHPCMSPARTARHRPLGRRLHTRIDRGAQGSHPGTW